MEALTQRRKIERLCRDLSMQQIPDDLDGDRLSAIGGPPDKCLEAVTGFTAGSSFNSSKVLVFTLPFNFATSHLSIDDGEYKELDCRA